jgi:hypothetical protein
MHVPHSGPRTLAGHGEFVHHRGRLVRPAGGDRQPAGHQPRRNEKDPWTNSCSMFHLAVVNQLRVVSFFRKS